MARRATAAPLRRRATAAATAAAYAAPLLLVLLGCLLAAGIPLASAAPARTHRAVVPAEPLDLILAASELDLENAVARGHRIHGVSDKLILLTVPAGAPVARDFEVLARLPYAQEHHTYFMVELEAPLGERAAAWTERLPAGVQLLHALPDRALFSAAGREVPAAALADAFPRTATVHPLAPHPFRPARARRFPAGVAAKRDAIADLIAKVSADEIEKYVTYLTGEDGVSPLRTRQAQSDDAVTATEWVEQQLRDLGFTTSRSSFSAQYCPNVVAEWRGAVEPDRYIIVGAHLDDRAQNIADPEVRAPGANDDGSGSGLVLELARVISSSNATFRYGVQIHTYCAEEQGLIGSRALAAEYADEGVDVIAMLQADMVGYQHGAEPELSFVNRYVDLDLMAFVQNVTATYLPDLATSETNACCSDHQSFLENGYASAGFVEAGGYTIDPQYHNTSCWVRLADDLAYRDGYSFVQIQLVGQAMLASLAVLAELQ